MLDNSANHFGIPRDHLRVLDWGCGRGKTVSKLLKMGFDAYGVDIDPGPIRNGALVMQSLGEDPQKRLICINSDCRTPFADNYFHIVLSNQVFEHVSDIDALASELNRITIPEGKSLHFFPAKWRVIEPHLFVPFVHWLPKNPLRRWYLRLMLNRIPVWKELEDKSIPERVQTYYNYSLQKTYYRRLNSIKTKLQNNGFDVEIFPTGSPGRWHRLLFPFLRLNNALTAKFWTWWVNSFRTCTIATTRK